MYRQEKDVSLAENTAVRQSRDERDLFECTYEINYAEKYVKRIRVRRLDEPAARQDNKLYLITKKTEVRGSPSGEGGEVIIAVEKDGSELLELGRRFCFTSRLSPLSQVITGVYKRVYPEQHHPNIVR